MIDRVSILAPSRASPLPQGFMVMQMLCMTLKPVGVGRLLSCAVFMWLLRRLGTFTGPSRHRHVVELLTDGIDA